MFVDSDDEDDFKDDVQQYVHSRDWDEEISDEEDEDDTDTVVEFPTGNDSGDFSLGDVKASLISSSEESKRQPLSDMFTTYLGYDEEVKEQQRRMKRNQPPAGDFGCSDPEMSGPEWDSDEGTVVDEQEEAFHGEIDEESGEIVVECEEDGVEESDEIVIPFNAQVAIREIPLNSNEDEAVVPATKEISREAIDEDVISADFENEKPVSLLDELLFLPIPLSSPKVVDIDEVAPFLGEDMSTLAPKQNIEIVLPIQEKEENSGDMSFLDSLLSSSMVISTPKVEEEQEDVPDPIPENSFVPPGYRDFEYDPETSQVNVWESKRQVYGYDYYLESAGVVSFQKKAKIHRLASISQIDYIEKMYCGDANARPKDLAGLFDVVDEAAFAVGDFVEPLPGFWSVKIGPIGLEELSTHFIQEIVCAAVNSRRKLDFVIGVDGEGKAVGCFIDRARRDVLKQAVEFAVTNEIEPPLPPLSVDLQMLQVGSLDAQMFVIRIVLDQIMPSLHCPANGFFYFVDGNGTQHVGSPEEAQTFLESKGSYADVEMEVAMLPNGCEKLSFSGRCSASSLALPLAAVFVGFFARKLLRRLICN